MSGRLRLHLHLYPLFLLVLSLPIMAQDTASDPDLIVDEQQIVTRPDIFGQNALFVEGILKNEGTSAYQDITLFAEVYDEDDELIGEGIGFPVTLCGAGLLPSFALQPGQTQTFDIALELYETPEGDPADIVERVALFPEGTAVEPTAANPFLTYDELVTVSDEEVVAVEWISATTLRYGVGCDSDPFTLLDWYEYDLETAERTAITHPRAEAISEATVRRLKLDAPTYFEHSFLSFHPDDRRMVYQNELNTVITAEPDGTFQRLLWDELSSYSLHGFIWLPEGRFLAYYYGAYGDLVRYFTASTAGQRISGAVVESAPSFTVPGPTPDGVRVVITTTKDDITGYYLSSTLNRESELLFAAEPPGNNWPAPVYVPTQRGEAYIYVIRPINNQARLQCYDTVADTLHSLAVLPLQLTQDDRAWTWLSAGGDTLAISANGQQGGLWLVNLRQFRACAPLTESVAG